MTTHLFRAVALAIGLGLLGCGSKSADERSATVTGKVTLANGKPLPGGTINFRSTTAAHRLGVGEIGADGTYEATNVPQGPCKVFIDNSHLKPVDKSSGYVPPAGGKQPLPGTKYVPIPHKYTSENTTDLTTTVTGDAATFNAELK
ncbi:MAG TPA: carboxypeptidase-like regulatory domain-containing protein [Gemmata sp.]